MLREEWEEENGAGDTDYLERDWSSLEIEEWIDEAADEMLPVDRFMRD